MIIFKFFGHRLQSLRLKIRFKMIFSGPTDSQTVRALANRGFQAKPAEVFLKKEQDRKPQRHKPYRKKGQFFGLTHF